MTPITCLLLSCFPIVGAVQVSPEIMLVQVLDGDQVQDVQLTNEQYQSCYGDEVITYGS